MPDDPLPLPARARELLTATPEFDGEAAHLSRLRDAARAAGVFDALVARWPGQVVRHGRPGWHHFRSSESFRALVCDATAEEGLNLRAAPQ